MWGAGTVEGLSINQSAPLFNKQGPKTLRATLHILAGWACSLLLWEGGKRGKRGMKVKERGAWRDWGWGLWWRRSRVWPVSPGVPVRFIFSVQGPGTAAWWDFQPCGLRCPSIHLEGCRVRSAEPATQRHSHKEQPVGQPMPLIWGSQLRSADRPTLGGTHSCQGHRLDPWATVCSVE